MRQVNIMCFTETFLQPQQQLDNNLPMQEECVIFRLDRQRSTNEDLMKGGIMIACPSSLQPVRINIPHPPQLEIVSIRAITTNSGCSICVIAVYRRPHQPLTAFLSLLSISVPQITPTIILGDFNEDLFSRSSQSALLQFMASRKFSQLVEVPTTDSGSLLDHIYYNGITDNIVVDVVDTYYSDHDATYLSLPI